MGNYQAFNEFNNLTGEILNLNKEYERIKKERSVVILNDISVRTDSDALSLRDRLTIKYTGDVLNFEEGSNPIEQPVTTDYWMKTPKGVDWYMHPAIKLMLDGKTSMKDSASGTVISVLSYFCDPMYKLPTGYVPNKKFKKLIDENIPRGINDFYHHFDKFLDIWFNVSNRRGGYTKFTEPVFDLIQVHRDCVFVKQLPMYTNHAFAIESTDTSESMDKSVIQHALDAVFTLTSLDMEIKALSNKRLQSKAWKVTCCMSESVNAFLKGVFLKKEGLLRKSNCGTPASFNSRCVIASNQRPNSSYRHLIIPWGVGMVLFAQEIGGILIREHGYSATEVFHMRAKYAKQFNQDIYDIMIAFLKSHPEGGKPCVLHRPPTLERGSHQGFTIPDVDTDPRNNVIYIPNITCRAFNADYDGDELTVTILHDEKMAKLFSGLDPHHGAMDLNSPLKLSGNLAIPKAHAVRMERFLKRHKVA